MPRQLFGTTPFLCALSGAIALLSCGKKDTKATDATVAATQPVTINFKATVGDAPLNCGQSYAGVGTTGSTIEVRDFRFYVYNPQLLKADGTKVALTLTQDGKWQRDNVALLDFTNGTGLCDSSGTSTNTAIGGTVPIGTYTGLSFQFGLPPKLNHLNAATETAPFNETGMWWTWKGGYKYSRFDFKTSGQDNFYIHMGATNCTGTVEAGFTCAYDYEPIMSFAAFDSATQAIKLDVKTLLTGSDLDAAPNTQAGDFVKGCMAFPGDQECPPIFEKLGLVFSSKDAGPAATAFTVVNL
ncbi:MAG: metallo-mystery pair system four-Cys motif protein [Deltaproteobacteria bacterium]|nr:metallo-mystery pair system four-Cys motif protein [Deltaproteobacteria bacterium]